MVEVHGAMPVDVEQMVPEGFALAMAEKADGLALTNLPFYFPGGTIISPATVQVSVRESIDYLMMICRSFIAQGFRVPRFYNGKQISQAYADVKLKKNISLAAVQAIDPSIQTLTKENIRRFVKDEDLVIRYKVETEQLANDWLAEEIKKQGKTMVESGEKPYIARKENQGGSSQGGNGGNPDDGMLG